MLYSSVIGGPAMNLHDSEIDQSYLPSKWVGFVIHSFLVTLHSMAGQKRGQKRLSCFCVAKMPDSCCSIRCSNRRGDKPGGLCFFRISSNKENPVEEILDLCH